MENDPDPADIKPTLQRETNLVCHTMSEQDQNKQKQRSGHRGREKANEKRILQKKTRQAGGNKKKSERRGTTGLYFTLYV